jgi:hypothetical protein
MALSCNGTGEITLQEIVNAVNANETSIGDLKLNDLTDVSAGSPSDNDIIIFDAVSGEWKAGSQQSSQIQSDWGQADNTKADFIKNKPDLSQYELSLGNPTSNGQILSSNISGTRSWINNISSVNLDFVPTPNNGTITNDSGDDALIPSATTIDAGLMSASDKSNLDTLWVLIDGGIY